MNYNVPLGQEATEPPRAVHDLTAMVPLPPDWKAASVKAYSPHPGENPGVRFTPEGAAVRLRIPNLALCQAVRILSESR